MFLWYIFWKEMRTIKLKFVNNNSYHIQPSCFLLWNNIFHCLLRPSFYIHSLIDIRSFLYFAPQSRRRVCLLHSSVCSKEQNLNKIWQHSYIIDDKWATLVSKSIFIWSGMLQSFNFQLHVRWLSLNSNKIVKNWFSKNNIEIWLCIGQGWVV